VASAIGRLGGESDVYLELAEPFIEDSTHLLVEIKQAVAQQQERELARYLHTLKGIAATMGANDLADLARQLEVSVKNQIDTKAPCEIAAEKIAELEAGLSAVHDALHQVLRQAEHTETAVSAAPQATPAASPVDVALDTQLHQRLKHLADLLRKADLTALSLYRELQQHHADILKMHGRLLAELISEFDFDRAATLCDALLDTFISTSNTTNKTS
jgi:HPt (histidine-containing phosphotransfer) domain-containing protein